MRPRVLLIACVALLSTGCERAGEPRADRTGQPDRRPLGNRVPACNPGDYKTRRLPDRYYSTPLRVGPDEAWEKQR